MCSVEMDIMAQDKIAVMKLNQLLLQMRTDFLSANNRFSAGMTCKELLLINTSTKGCIPRSSTYHGERGEVDKKNKDERQRSLPILNEQMKEEIVCKLDGLLGHLETIGEKGLFSQVKQEDEHEPQYATIEEMNKNLRTLDEPRYSTINNFPFAPSERHKVAHGDEGYSVGSIKDERYMLDDAACYLTRSWFSRNHSLGSKYMSKNSSDFGYLQRFSSNGMINDLQNLNQHSTLCRRLRSLEASVGITLKKQLHLFVKKKMKSMNVSGCVYCMYAFYEKHKREAEEKAQEIRKTIKEQEYIHHTLNEQKKQSDADSLWLESEERFSYVPKSPDNMRCYSWREGLHKSGSKSDTEQLGCNRAHDIKKKQLPPLRLRRSIPLWELLKRDREIPCDEDIPLAATITTTVSEVSVTTDTSSIDSPLSVVTSHCEIIMSSNIKKNEKSETSTESGDSNSNETITDIESRSCSSTCNKSTEAKYLQTQTSVFSNDSVFLHDNADDVVYQRTANVVKSIVELNTGVQHAQPEEFLDLVNVVGLNLRDLLTTVDEEIKEIPSDLHKEVEMAHRVLSSDMAELVAKMKITQKYADTTLDRQNRRYMLQAAHVLAIDAKNLYDTYSKLRGTPENSNPS